MWHRLGHPRSPEVHCKALCRRGGDRSAVRSLHMAAGTPVVVEHTPTFVDGISGTMVPDEMWPLASLLMDGALVSTLEEVAAAVKLMVERNRVIAEGAGAASVAAAIAGKAGTGKIACIVSGGNIDTTRFQKVLQGKVP